MIAEICVLSAAVAVPEDDHAERELSEAPADAEIRTAFPLFSPPRERGTGLRAGARADACSRYRANRRERARGRANAQTGTR